MDLNTNNARCRRGIPGYVSKRVWSGNDMFRLVSFGICIHSVRYAHPPEMLLYAKDRARFSHDTVCFGHRTTVFSRKSFYVVRPARKTQHRDVRNRTRTIRSSDRMWCEPIAWCDSDVLQARRKSSVVYTGVNFCSFITAKHRKR